MTKDEIIELARKAQVHEELCGEHFIYEFAKLVAEKEHEACAKICEEPWQGSPKGIAEQIRARGQE